MKATGIVRCIDELGRIVLPKELRTTMSIRPKDAFEIFLEEDKIILRRYEPADIFTGDSEDLIEYEGRKVSRKSVLEMAEMIGLDIT